GGAVRADGDPRLDKEVERGAHGGAGGDGDARGEGAGEGVAVGAYGVEAEVEDEGGRSEVRDDDEDLEGVARRDGGVEGAGRQREGERRPHVQPDDEAVPAAVVARVVGARRRGEACGGSPAGDGG